MSMKALSCCELHQIPKLLANYENVMLRIQADEE